MGFIITGSAPKRVLLRAIGPSLTRFGIDPADVLADPTRSCALRAHHLLPRSTTTTGKRNPAQRDLIQSTGLPPTNDTRISDR